MSKKGPSFERDLAVKLSLWWSEGKNSDVFWRTANSGGRATIRHRAGKRAKGIHGDLMATDPDGQPFIDTFLIEIKRGYSQHSIYDLIDKGKKNKPIYEKWIPKAEDSVNKCGALTWLIIHKRDGRCPMVIFDTLFFCDFADLAISTSADVRVEIPLTDQPPKILVGWRLDHFLTYLHPSMVRNVANRRLRDA